MKLHNNYTDFDETKIKNFSHGSIYIGEGIWSTIVSIFLVDQADTERGARSFIWRLILEEII